MTRYVLAVIGAALLGITGGLMESTHAQQPLSPELAWAAEIAGLNSTYRVTPNVTYLTASNTALKLDLYEPLGATRPTPTVVYTHGGGWGGGSKEGSSLTFLPYLQMGWSVVNVEYRFASTALAPAAVEDSLCALRWVFRNAKQHNFDLTKIVTSGESSGGHLALMNGMTPAAAGLDRQCPGPETVKVAAIVNWYGPSDVVNLLEGANMRPWAVAWLGRQPNREEVAKRVSPISYVRAGLPPVLTIHGDADPVVPYDQSVKLHDALTRAGVPNQLLTIRGGRHDAPKGFTRAEMHLAFATVVQFLEAHGLAPRAAGSQ